MAKSLVVVESPAKARTINKYLGKGYIVKASLGHVLDLPKSKLGVDEENDFQPTLTVLPKKKKVLDELKKAAKRADTIYLATDPDREGEAIGAHLARELGSNGKELYRVLLEEITKRGVQRAFENPGEIDQQKVDAQLARRILDRLMGYKISPLLWDKVRRGLSAGRVQSVALRIICEREMERDAFVSGGVLDSHRGSSRAIRRRRSRPSCTRSTARRPSRSPTRRSPTSASSPRPRTPSSRSPRSRPRRRSAIRCRRSSPPSCSRTPRAAWASR